MDENWKIRLSLLHLLECHGGTVIDRTEMMFDLSDPP